MKTILNVRVISFEVFQRIARYQLKKWLEKNVGHRNFARELSVTGIPPLDLKGNNFTLFVAWSFLKLHLPNCGVDIGGGRIFLIYYASTMLAATGGYYYVL